MWPDGTGGFGYGRCDAPLLYLCGQYLLWVSLGFFCLFLDCLAKNRLGRYSRLCAKERCWLVVRGSLVNYVPVFLVCLAFKYYT